MKDSVRLDRNATEGQQRASCSHSCNERPRALHGQCLGVDVAAAVPVFSRILPVGSHHPERLLSHPAGVVLRFHCPEHLLSHPVGMIMAYRTACVLFAAYDAAHNEMANCSSVKIALWYLQTEI